MSHRKPKITKFGDQQASEMSVRTKYFFIIRCTWTTNLEAWLPQQEYLGARHPRNFYSGNQLWGLDTLAKMLWSPRGSLKFSLGHSLAKWDPEVLKGAFRSFKNSLTFKTRLSAKPLLWKWVLFSWEKNHFHINGFANGGLVQLKNGYCSEHKKKPFPFKTSWRDLFPTHLGRSGWSRAVL